MRRPGALRHASGFVVAALVLLFAGCTAAPVRPDLSPAQVAAAELAQTEREQALRTRQDWSLAGRIAVSNRGHGGSGRIEWTQRGPHYQVGLSAPVTRQGWRLSGDPGQALLEGLDGGPRRGTDARQLLLAATGWDIPVLALAEWIRGARADKLGPARITYGANGLPWSIEQGGWLIQYQWPDPKPLDPTASPNALLLPSRLDATRGEASVKLIVDDWNGA